MNSAAQKPQRLRRWHRYLAAALLLHLLLAGSLYMGVDWLRERMGRGAEKPVIVFELVAPPSASPSESASESVAESAEAPSAAVEHAPAVPRAVRVLAVEVPELFDARSELALSDRVQESSWDAIPEAMEAAPEGVMQIAGGASAEAAHEAVQNWESVLLLHLDRYKRYPVWAERRGQEDVVQVQVRVDRSGQVIERRIVGGRGYPLLDAEVLDLLLRASPLPPPPAEAAERDLEFRLPVEFFIDRRVARLW